MATAVGWLLVRTSQSHGIHSTSPNPRWMTRNLLKVGHPTCMIPQVKHTDYPDQCVYLYIYTNTCNLLLSLSLTMKKCIFQNLHFLLSQNLTLMKILSHVFWKFNMIYEIYFTSTKLTIPYLCFWDSSVDISPSLLQHPSPNTPLSFRNDLYLLASKSGEQVS